MKKKLIILLSLMLIIMMLPINAFAVRAFGPYVTYDETEKTLTYYYGSMESTPLLISSVDDFFEIIEPNVYFAAHQNAEKIVIDDSFLEYKPTSLSHAFSSFKKVSAIEGLENLDTSEATTMQSMFDNDLELQSLDLSTFNTSKVTNMDRMFYACMSLESLTLTNFDTSKVRSMPLMFSTCTSLTTLDLRSFDTRACQNFDEMFTSCTNLAKIYASENLVISDSTFAHENVFSGCDALYGDFGTIVPYVPTEEDHLNLFHIDRHDNPGVFSNGTPFDIQIEGGTIKIGQMLMYATITGTVTKDGITIPGEFSCDDYSYVFKEEDREKEFLVTFHSNTFTPKLPLQAYTKLTVIEEPIPVDPNKEKSPKTGVNDYLPIALGLSLTGFLGAVLLKRKEEK